MVVGATGGLGTHLCKQSLKRGHQVTGVVRSRTKIESKYSEEERKQISFKVGTIEDPAFLSEAFAGADVVVEVLSNNVRPHFIKLLLDAAKVDKVKSFVISGGAGQLEVKPGVTLAQSDPEWGRGWLNDVTNLHFGVQELSLLYASSMSVTQFAPPSMTEGEMTGNVVPSLDGQLGETKVTYGDAAHCLLEVLEKVPVDARNRRVIALHKYHAEL